MNKINLFLFCLSLLLIKYPVQSMDSLTSSEIKLVPGIYTTFEEFKNRSPSLKIEYNIEKDDTKNRILVYDKKNKIWYYDQKSNDYLLKNLTEEMLNSTAKNEFYLQKLLKKKNQMIIK